VFVVMELVDGENLQHWLATERDTATICDVFAQATRGVAAAHAASIVHRDLKPENMLIGRDGRVRVADFGLSRISGPTFIRIADLGGTPKYMAPELWNGAAPTAASDVYALCVALAEAFGMSIELERARLEKLPPPVAAVLEAGLSKDPGRRPSAAALEAALVPRGRGRSRAAVIDVVGLAAATAGIAVAVAVGSPAETCVDDPSLFATRWNAGVRDALRAKLAAPPAEIDRVFAAVDARVASIVRDHRGVCEAKKRDQLTLAQANVRAGCLVRRAIGFGAATRLLAEKPKIALGDVEERLASRQAPCDLVIVDPPKDVPAVEALYLRYLKIGTNRDLAEPVALERAAAALGEGELEVRAATLLGQRQRDEGKLDLSAETLDRAYRRALAIRSTDQQVFALASRSETAIRAGDSKAAASYAQLVRGLIEGADVPPRTRVAVYRTLGRSQLVRGDHQGAVTLLKRGLAALREGGERYAVGEHLTRMDLIDALLFQHSEASAAEGLALALESVERTRTLLGEDSKQFALALNQVRKAYEFNHQGDKALDYANRALAAIAARLPADHGDVLHQRAEVAQTLLGLHRIDEARAELTAVFAIADKTPGKLMSTPYFRLRLASAIVPRDPADGIARFERGLQELISQLGSDHPSVQNERVQLAQHQLDAGKLDAAEQTLATLDQILASQTTERAKQQRARAKGELVSRLHLARGATKAAEAAAREALAAQAELGIPKIATQDTRVALGYALVSQRRLVEARVAFEDALAIARAADSEADVIAIAELGLVHVEAALGDRRAAIARAVRVRDVLEKFPDRPAARAEVAAFLALRP
jgi:eukaryotic-like serine/threonine-protein kinase